MKQLLFLVLFCPLITQAQQRILVAPGGDVRPLTGRESASSIVRSEAARFQAAACSDQGTFGYSKDQHPNANVQFEAFHKDIVAMWYTAPANGTIDTVFVYNLDVGTQDSTVTIRLFNSNIYPGSGPGYDGYPNPGKLCWGYYQSTNDDDNGLAAFPEDATDTTWYSTVPGAIPSFTPMGTEIWGFGGFPKVMSANTTNFVDLAQLATASVTAGQPFFITIKMYGPHVEQAQDKRTGYLAASESDPLQTHNWKFYEHIYQGPGFTCPGWVARGEFNFLIWYSMTVTTNLPPAFSDVTRLGNTLSTADRTIQATIIDCDAATPTLAGVEEARLRYAVNDVAQPDVPLTYLGGDTWEGAIPGANENDRISYKLVAVDSTGFADSTSATTYRVVGLANGWYAADTAAACADRDIRLTGSTIAPGSFFVPGYPGAGTFPKDDGTAGPIDMGYPFIAFGDTFRYAWVGVNGGLALGKSPTDTLDVNSNGFGTLLWDFPGAQKAGRQDTAGAFDMPGMFIAPFWADMILGDSSATYGRIVYGNDGDSCAFIVEWDSLGAFDAGEPVADATTFRVVIDRCAGTIDFEYANVGTFGLESTALAGMQADSNAVSGPSPGWIYLNRQASPPETTPRNGWCVRFYPTVGTAVNDGWNMVAVSLDPVGGNYSRASLFPGTGTPGAASAAFRYSAGYLSSDTLQHGIGYWIKFDGAGNAGETPGTFVHDVIAPVQDKWNMIGGPTGFVPTASIVATGTSVASSYFGYGPSGYFSTATLSQGKGYWVKVSGNGTLEMHSTASVPKAAASGPPGADPDRLNSLTFRDATGRSGTIYFGSPDATGNDMEIFELPPPPPAGAFDVRFGTHRFVERLPEHPEGLAGFVLPVGLTGARWPVTLTWVINQEPGERGAFILAGGGGTGSARGDLPARLTGSGSVLLRDTHSGNFSLQYAGGAGRPTAYALGQNYPNPFNPATRLSYALPEGGHVTVKVFDLLGREVRTLVDELKGAGTYDASWDGKDANGLGVTTGIYIVRMTSGEFTASRKAVLMQ